MKLQDFLSEWAAISKGTSGLSIDHQLKLLEQWVIIKQKIAVADYAGKMVQAFILQMGKLLISEAQKQGLAAESVASLEEALKELEEGLKKSEGTVAAGFSATS